MVPYIVIAVPFAFFLLLVLFVYSKKIRNSISKVFGYAACPHCGDTLLFNGTITMACKDTDREVEVCTACGDSEESKRKIFIDLREGRIGKNRSSEIASIIAIHERMAKQHKNAN